MGATTVAEAYVTSGGAMVARGTCTAARATCTLGTCHAIGGTSVRPSRPEARRTRGGT